MTSVGQHQAAADPQTKPKPSESTYQLLSSIPTIPFRIVPKADNHNHCNNKRQQSRWTSKPFLFK